MPIPDPILQDPEEQWPPLILGLIRVLACQREHRILNDIQGLVGISNCVFCHVKRLVFHVRQKAVHRGYRIHDYHIAEGGQPPPRLIEPLSL